MAIKTLIVDDSSLMRGLLTQLIGSDPEIEIVGTAEDAPTAREAIKRVNPDVVTLDVEMPGMDGIAFLEKIMLLRPMPVVMVSTLTQRGTSTTIKALEIGAVECVGKPAMEGDDKVMDAFAAELRAKVKMAAVANVTNRSQQDATPSVIANARARIAATNPYKIIGLGSSTGGVQALHDFLPLLPDNIPPMVIVQHIQDSFVPSFVSRLDTICQCSVKEITEEMKLEKGTIYVASGGLHTEIVRRGAFLYAIRNGEERVTNHLPSVDVLFHSIAREVREDAVGIILTGMGKDGAEGMLAMRKAGARTLGQNAASCVVYGMPKMAMEMGGVGKEVSLNQMAEEVLNILH